MGVKGLEPLQRVGSGHHLQLKGIVASTTNLFILDYYCSCCIRHYTLWQ